MYQYKIDLLFVLEYTIILFSQLLLNFIQRKSEYTYPLIHSPK